MLLVLGTLTVTGALLAASFTAATGQINVTGGDTAQKKAYYAALAGIDDYAYHLTEDGNYLDYCTEPPVANPALNQEGSKANKAKVPGKTESESSGEEYAIQLLLSESGKEEGKTKCTKEKEVVQEMIERKESAIPALGTFRIESTGYAKAPGGHVFERSIVATFKNSGFVSFVYYTAFETSDPVTYTNKAHSPSEYQKCRSLYPERIKLGYCNNIFFLSVDHVKGPVHSNDHVGICETPTFGRNARDNVEFGTSYERRRRLLERGPRVRGGLGEEHVHRQEDSRRRSPLDSTAAQRRRTRRHHEGRIAANRTTSRAAPK